MALNIKESSFFGPYFPHLFHVQLYILLVTLSGDVELKPGPKRNAAQNLSMCHWNLNSIRAHNFAKLSLLRGYVSVHKFDIILPVRDKSWFQCWWWKLGNLRILSDTLWTPIQQNLWWYLYLLWKLSSLKSHWCRSFRRMHCFWFDNKQQIL